MRYATICSQHLLENSPENIWNQRFFVSKFALRKAPRWQMSRTKGASYQLKKTIVMKKNVLIVMMSGMMLFIMRLVVYTIILV